MSLYPNFIYTDVCSLVPRHKAKFVTSYVRIQKDDPQTACWWGVKLYRRNQQSSKANKVMTLTKYGHVLVLGHVLPGSNPTQNVCRGTSGVVYLVTKPNENYIKDNDDMYNKPVPCGWPMHGVFQHWETCGWAVKCIFENSDFRLVESYCLW